MALVLLLGVVFLPQRAVASPEWSGVVTDDQRRPLAGARVEVLEEATVHEIGLLRLDGGAPTVLSQTTTGEDGRWRLPAKGQGLRRLRISAPGRFPVVRPAVADAPGDYSSASTALQEAREVAVRVVDPAGRPVPAARVFLTHFRSSSWSLERWTWLTDSAVTREDGTATLRAWPKATAHLVALPPPGRTDLAPAAETAAREAGTTELALRPAVPRTLVVQTPSGEPASGVLVELEPGLPLAVSDAEGRAVVPVPADGEPFVVRLAAADQSTGRVELSVPKPATEEGGPSTSAASAEPIRARLVPPVILTGTVRGRPDGEPVVGAHVWLLVDEPLRTGPDGSFRTQRAADLLATQGEELQMTVWADGFRSFSARTPVQDQHLDLLLDPASGLAGRVVDEQGAGIGGAWIEVRQRLPWWPGGLAPQPWATTRSGSDGRFELPDLPPGDVLQLEVVHPDFPPVQQIEPALEGGERRSGIDVVLAPGVGATVRVLDASGRVLPGAQARLRLQQEGKGAGDGAPHETGWRPCNDAGLWGFTALGGGRYDLQAAAPGHARQLVPGVQVDPERLPPDTPADLGTVYLEPAVAVEGRIVDDLGTAVEGAEVKPASPREPSDPWTQPSEPARSGPDGRFVLGGLAREPSLDLEVAAPGHAQVLLPRVEPPVEGLEVRLVRTATVSGRVVDENGDPVTARVRQEPSSTGRQLGSGASTSSSQEDGRFELPGVTPGQAILVANAYRSGEATVQLDLEPGEHREDVRLVVPEAPARGRIVGRVTEPDGSPLSRARVTWRIESPTGTGSSSGIGTGPTGEFEVDVAAGEAGELEIDHPDYQRQVRRLTPSAGENRVDVVLEPGGVRVEGRVVDDAGLPVAGATVSLFRSEEGSTGTLFGWDHLQTVSARDGGFQLAGVDRGSYQVRGSAPGYVEAVLAEPLEVGAVPLAGLRLVLERGRSIRGRVEGLGPAQLPEIRIDAYPSGPGRPPGREPRGAAVDHAGRFLLEGLAPGRWLVQVSTERRSTLARQLVEVPADGDPPEIVLQAGGDHTLRGTVRVNGSPASGIGLTLNNRQGQYRSGTTGPDGGFRFDDLPSDEWVLRVSDFGASRTVDLHEDRVVDLDLHTAILVVRVTGQDGSLLPFTLSLQSGGAGTSRSYRPQQELRLPVGVNRYQLKVSSPGRVPVEMDVTVAPGEERVVTFQLRREEE